MNAPNVFDPRCPWSNVCRCTHTSCVRGWLDDQPGVTVKGNKSDAVAKRCPVCDAARRNLPYIPPPTDPASLAAGEGREWETNEIAWRTR